MKYIVLGEKAGENENGFLCFKLVMKIIIFHNNNFYSLHNLGHFIKHKRINIDIKHIGVKQYSF